MTPLLLTIAGFYLVVLLRAGGTYALGRLAAGGAQRLERLRAVQQRADRTMPFVDRWGALAVLGSFLTIGLQTATNLAAGLLRMPLRAYLPALAAGGLLWAVIYGALGVGAWEGLAELLRTQPVLAVALLTGLATAVVLVILRGVRLRAGTRGAARIGSPAGPEPTESS